MRRIEFNGEVYAIIISNSYCKEGVEFFTPDSYSQQLAYMNHPKGHEVQPHIHNEIAREVFYTQETLVIRKGKVKVDFYNNEKEYLASEVIESGDVILLVSGGHGFKMLEPTQMIEIKQGPYAGENDKVRFNANK
jgi:mannose-6-phosphate isomerase-like protein (cupin superfamily)